eukprot:CAMPEP_0201593368 /NCGR_PEP_ID=MMETSP0190_2-20130828/190991_1 /ASSEMBLY_ACC=CAM_ASM_000263 /TAXON_ID=37353 /ORGANISM="Rosalina sp." /LENGTH=294 /DNA_ID=CAMNT_0048052521 /DNA_START=453 /DNA_END=1334 /DNA_ORIENTATION=-
MDVVFQKNARQQFNRFLLQQHQIARSQTEQLPKLTEAVKKAEGCDAALKDATSWLQRQKLDEDERKIFGDALSVRNKFWNLLIDTRKFINNGYVNASDICNVFVRWDKISQQTSTLTARDKQILVWGLTELTKFTDKDKGEQAKNLQEKWRELSHKITKCKEDLQRLQQNWIDKVERAKNVALWCNLIGSILVVGGIVGGIVAATTTAPVWVPYASGVSAIAGFVAVIGGQVNLKTHQGIQQKIDDMQDHMISYEDHVQQWVESIAQLKVPLWGIGIGQKIDDYKPVIDEWTKI